MIVALTRYAEEVKLEHKVDAVDIHSKRYRILIRANGVLIQRIYRSKKTKKVVVKYERRISIKEPK